MRNQAEKVSQPMAPEMRWVSVPDGRGGSRMEIRWSVPAMEVAPAYAA